MKPILLIITLLLTSFSLQAQTDFPAMKQHFIDYRKADHQDSALYIARKMNQLALQEQSRNHTYCYPWLCLSGCQGEQKATTTNGN